MKRVLLLGLLPALLLAGPRATAREDPLPAPQGITMRIAQEINLGDLSCTTDYRARFLAPRFRIEGAMHLTEMEMTVKLVMVSDGKVVRQLSQTPLGAQAFTIDLARIRKVVPEYSPSNTYDPAAYQGLMESFPNRKSLPAEVMDGVQVKGCELPLERGRLSLPSNVPIGLPDPARLRLWVNPEDGIARKVELEDRDGRTFLRTYYTDVKTHVSLPPETFEFRFPEGAEPTDATDFILGSVAATRRAPGSAAPESPASGGER